jgi:signal transduction histidine kinase/ActR/RegA family two-component response regulator
MRPASTIVTRVIWLATAAAVVAVMAVSVMTYRAAVAETVAAQASQQLAVLRTAAVAIESEIYSLTLQLRQFNGLPSVQSLDVPRLGPRVEAAFGQHVHGVLRNVARIDAGRRLYVWTYKGQQTANGEPMEVSPDIWRWARDPANKSQVRVLRGWSNAPTERRALAMPVWQTAPSIEVPAPSNEFNGIVVLTLDLSRLVTIYLSPAMNELASQRLTVGLATPGLGLLMEPGSDTLRQTSGDRHNHAEPRGTSILNDEDGRRVHAWAKLTAADETWLVASSANHDVIAGGIRGASLSQLGLSGALLVAIPLVGFGIVRRERRAKEEQRRLERQLAESQKMEAIGKLAGGVAHDFNNMLTAILGYASMIEDDAPPESGIRDQAKQIRHAGESAAALTQKLLAFGRRQVLNVEEVNFPAMVPNLAVLIRRVIGENITVVTDVDAEAWPILADAVQLEQAVLNLAINARDAMPSGGTLRILVRNAPRPAGARRADGDVKPGDYVEVAVSDTGVGMDEATRGRMFEPFFTTKPKGQGTGLGLSTVYGFVRQCGGYIDVRSSPGQGTTVELLLPRSSGAPQAPTAPAARPATAVDGFGGSETVLVVEDEQAVRDLAVKSLRRRGYCVLVADNGQQALDSAASHDGPIHLLLSDVVMPGMTGPELAARLRTLRPQLRVLLMSGYAGDAVRSDDLAAATLITKPFSSATLAQAVRESLDAPLAPGQKNR